MSSWSWANPKSYYTSKPVTTAVGEITQVRSSSGDGSNNNNTNSKETASNNQNSDGYWSINSWGTYFVRRDKVVVTEPTLSREGGIKVESEQQVIEYILRWLNKHHRVKHLGVFRASGKRSSMNTLYNDYHQFHSLKLEDSDDVHTICGLLSKILRELQPPLIPLEHVSPHNEEALSSFKTFYQTEIPEPRKIILEKLIRFYKFVSDFEQENKMTIHNLSIVIGPNLCRKINEDIEAGSEFQLLEDSRRGVFLSEALLSHCDEFFGEQKLVKMESQQNKPADTCTVEGNKNELLLMTAEEVYDDHVYKCDICKQSSEGGLFYHDEETLFNAHPNCIPKNVQSGGD